MGHPSSTPPSVDPTTPAPDPAGWLWCAALGCWFLSLAMPGYVTGQQPETSAYGFLILLIGLPFGWMVNGWAVYANVPFLMVLILVKRGKSAWIWVTLMLLLAATLPFFSGDIPGENWTTERVPVTAWGWGALVWLTALLLAAAASGVQQRWFTAKPVWAGLGVIYVLVAILHVYQWRKADVRERDWYLSKGMAFAVTPFCGAPFVWPQGALIGSDEIPELDIDEVYKDKSIGRIPFPTIEKYQSNGFAWITYNYPGLETIKVRYLAHPPHFTLSVKTVGRDSVIRLEQNSTNRVLYEQRVHWLAHGGYDKPEKYCPEYLDKGKYKGYKQAILRALGQTDKPFTTDPDAYHVPLQTEIAHVPCEPGQQNIDGIDGLRAWDGRQAILEYGLNDRKFFCSAHYIASAELRAPSNTPAHLLGSITVFDRPTLRPLAKFDFTKTNSCPCSDVSRDLITGVRVSDREAIIETTQGDIQTGRVR